MLKYPYVPRHVQPGPIVVPGQGTGGELRQDNHQTGDPQLPNKLECPVLVDTESYSVASPPKVARRDLNQIQIASISLFPKSSDKAEFTEFTLWLLIQQSIHNFKKDNHQGEKRL